MKPAANKILIIKLRAIGDVVLATIVISNLRQAYPHAQIDFLTERLAVEVVEGNPELNQILVLDRKRIQALPAKQQLIENLRFIRRLRNQKYDLVFDFFGNPRSAILTWLSGAKIRVGYNWRGRQLAYNQVVQSRAAIVHEAEFHLDALMAMDIPVQARQLSFPIDEAGSRFANQFIVKNKLNNRLLVGLNCYGGWEAKRWPLENFAALANRFVEKCQAGILLLWGPGEKSYAEKVQEKMKYPALLAPPTSLKQLGALLKQCQLLVSNDSGPMHIAAALGVPTVGIFGPTNFRLQGPYGKKNEVARKETLDCLGCNLLTCDHNSCMQQLSVEDVWEAVSRCMKKNSIICEI